MYFIVFFFVTGRTLHTYHARVCGFRSGVMLLALTGHCASTVTCFCHLPPGFLSHCKEERLPELFPQTPAPSYSWPLRTQVADKVVSPSCFRSSLPSWPFSWCPLCHYFCPSVVFESCNVSHPSMFSLLDNVYDVIYTCLMSYPGITFVVARVMPSMMRSILRCVTESSFMRTFCLDFKWPVHWERGSSAVERQTHNLGTPGSNHLCYRFDDCAFSFSPLTPLFTQLYKWVPGYRQCWTCEWFSRCA